MKKQIYQTAAAIAVGLGLSGSALAADTPFYAELQFGGSALQSGTGDVLDLTGFGNGFSGSILVGGGFGYRLPLDASGWAVRAEATATIRPNFSLNSAASDGDSPPTTVSANGTAESTVLLFNAWLDIPTGTAFQPYVGGGIGEAWNTLGTTHFETEGQPVFNEGSRTTNHIAFTAGAGVGYAIGTNWTLDAGYRYLDAGSFSTDGILTTTAGDQIQDTPIKTNLRAHEGMLTIRRYF
jgi:opacity protein-like surface antigen